LLALGALVVGVLGRGGHSRSAVASSPQAYLNRAVDEMQRHSLYRDRVDWRAFRAEALRRARGARTTADTYPVIRDAVGALGDRHSGFYTPAEARALFRGESFGVGFTALFPERVVVDVEPGGPAARA